MSKGQKIHGKGLSKSKWMKEDFLPYLEENHPGVKDVYHHRLEEEKQKKEESEYWIFPPQSPTISWSLLVEIIDETLSQLEEKTIQQDEEDWIEVKEFRKILNRLIRKKINNPREDGVYF